MTKISSFDVFDTVLTRAVGSPKSAFMLLGKKLASRAMVSCTPEAFARARINAENRAYRNANGKPVTLEKIYSELDGSLGMTQTDCVNIAAMEEELEAEIIREVPGAGERIRRARERSGRVVFLSDMYLSSGFIQDQLSNRALWQAGDQCYVSSEWHGSKSDGALFDILLDQEKVPPKAVTHQGDHAASDVGIPRRAGLNVNPFFETRLNRYEKILESYAWHTEGLSSLMAGASRLTRLKTPGLNPEEKAITRVVSSVAAPTLVSFVLWTLKRSEKLGLKRLYFISRDGHILFEIARQLASRLNLACELRYLHGNRKIWNQAAITRIDPEALIRSWRHTGTDSLKSFFSWVDIEKTETVEAVLGSLGCPFRDWNHPLVPADHEWLYRILKEPAICELILKNAAKTRELLTAYLKQEGLLDPIEYGLVDTGWRGTMQHSLCVVIGEQPEGKKPVGLYFGLRRNPLLQDGVMQAEAYLSNQHLGIGRRDIPMCPDLMTLIELFCKSEHAGLAGYEKMNGSIEPALAKRPAPDESAWQPPLVRGTVRDFINNLPIHDDLVNVEADMREAVHHVLREFWLDPTYEEVRACAGSRYEHGFGSETFSHPLARRFQWIDLLKTLWYGKLSFRPCMSWFKGSFVLTPAPLRFLIRAGLYLRRTKKPRMRARTPAGTTRP
ncbi:MAG: hypothetical protein ACREH5_06660 [Candidatus Omnitrophota bacterium]